MEAEFRLKKLEKGEIKERPEENTYIGRATFNKAPLNLKVKK